MNWYEQWITAHIVVLRRDYIMNPITAFIVGLMIGLLSR